MKSTLLAVLLGAMAWAGPAPAEEDQWIRQTVFGMDCAPCAYAVERGLGSMSGVVSVEVSLERGIAELRLDADAEPDMARIREVILRNGFTPKEGSVRLGGTLTGKGGEFALAVGSLSYALEGTEAVPARTLSGLVGRWITVTGRVPEGEPGRIQVEDVSDP